MTMTTFPLNKTIDIESNPVLRKNKLAISLCDAHLNT